MWSKCRNIIGDQYVTYPLRLKATTGAHFQLLVHAVVELYRKKQPGLGELERLEIDFTTDEFCSSVHF